MLLAPETVAKVTAHFVLVFCLPPHYQPPGYLALGPRPWKGFREAKSPVELAYCTETSSGMVA